jgi:hypothetical protein
MVPGNEQDACSDIANRGGLRACSMAGSLRILRGSAAG